MGGPAPSGAAVLPMISDLNTVTVGTFAEYNVSLPRMPQMKQRFALIGRAGGNNIVEIRAEGGSLPGGAIFDVRMEVAGNAGSPESIKKLALSINRGDPMDVPRQMGDMAGARMQKLDPATQVGTETIKTPAGTFKTKKFRETAPDGTTIDVWATEAIPPLGLVKLSASTGLQLLLAKHGTGAKPNITRPVKPFDQFTLVQSLMSLSQKPAAAAPAPGPAKKTAATAPASKAKSPAAAKDSSTKNAAPSAR